MHGAIAIAIRCRRSSSGHERSRAGAMRARPDRSAILRLRLRARRHRRGRASIGYLVGHRRDRGIARALGRAVPPVFDAAVAEDVAALHAGQRQQAERAALHGSIAMRLAQLDGGSQVANSSRPTTSPWPIASTQERDDMLKTVPERPRMPRAVHRTPAWKCAPRASRSQLATSLRRASPRWWPRAIRGSGRDDRTAVPLPSSCRRPSRPSVRPRPSRP